MHSDHYIKQSVGLRTVVVVITSQHMKPKVDLISVIKANYHLYWQTTSSAQEMSTEYKTLLRSKYFCSYSNKPPTT